MITLVAAVGIFIGKSHVQAVKAPKPPSIQLQERTYPLTQAMEVTGEGAVLDGHGATLSGSGKGVGVHIGPYGHVTVKNLKLVGFSTAILAQGASDLTLTNVSVSKSTIGIKLEKVAEGLLQGVQAHAGGTGSALSGCSKIIFEHSDLSQNGNVGLEMATCSSCIIRDNKIASIGDGTAAEAGSGTGLSLGSASSHNQILRNVVIHCRAVGIGSNSTSEQPSSDNTFQGNDVSWTTGGKGLSVTGESASRLLDNTAGYCQVGFSLARTAKTTVRGNLAVGCSQAGIVDESGSANVYDTNVFVQENGGPVAMSLKGSSTAVSGISLLKNVFMGFVKPIHVENVSPLTLQSNSFPWVKSAELDDIAVVVGKRPIALESQNDKPKGIDFVPSTGAVAQIPTIYDRLGGISVSSARDGEMEIVVEGSLSGAFQGEEEILARFKGLLPVELTFPPRFEVFVRIRQVAEKPVYFAFLALLGDNSIAKDKPADDSDDTLFTPGFAVDGDVTTLDNGWKPPKGKAGEWWEVDLKGDRQMEAFSILPNPARPDDFWTKFHIAVSSTGLFKGEETTVVTETNWLQKPGPQRVYRFPPVTARYIRIYGDVDQQNVELKQFGVYGVKQ